MIWREEANAEQHSSLTLVGRIMVFFNEPLVIKNQIQFVSYYPDNNNYLINGTQIIPEQELGSTFNYIFENPNEKTI
jgi:hypothetical protein